MNLDKDRDPVKDIIDRGLPYESQVDILLQILGNVLDTGAIRARTIKFKLQNYSASDDICERVYALAKIATDGKGIKEVPEYDEIDFVLDEVCSAITDLLAKKYIQNKIESKVEQAIMEKQEKYVDEIRKSVINKQKGSENQKTKKKYDYLVGLDSRVTSKNIMTLLRPENFDEIVGQDRAIKSLISKLSSPYPQHIILYGPPGVGKTTAARIALNEARKLNFTPFDEESKFVEVDGTTLRWDPREITNPLLGSVHDPIYQGSKRDLADIGVPEPKPGLVTEAHGGVLFIDEIGELDSILQNKLLKVLEDKRVEFSSSYYDPDDENTPKYIKYLFEKGAPADFVLIGATTREPAEINPALRSRCTEVFFEPLTNKDVKLIVENAARKLDVEIEDGISELISRYTIEGRKAVNILTDAYGYALYEANSKDEARIKISHVEQVLATGRFVPYEMAHNLDKTEIGCIYGLGVSGFMGSTLEIEATVFEAEEKGKGRLRFNDTAGSMAKDSVFNAASVIRKVTGKNLADYDVHINAVGGGKIDGPSAGTAITICIISALLNKPIKQDIAITGEISLRGDVKPVGGIFEKIYGARRKGIRLVLVPDDNKGEIPEGLTDIEVIPVKNIEEVIDIVFNRV